MFIRFVVVASQTCKITRNFQKIWTFNRSWSSKVIDLLPIESTHATSYYSLIVTVTLDVSRTVFEMLTHKAIENSLCSHPTLAWIPRSGGTRQNFWKKIIPQNYKNVVTVWWKLFILTSTVLTDPPVWRTDRQTDGWTIAYSTALCICSLALENTSDSVHFPVYKEIIRLLRPLTVQTGNDV